MIDILKRDMGGGWIAEMHRLRHEVFKERLDWDVASHNGLEIDEFDHLDCTYLIARGRQGEVLGCWRLLPTTGPYMLRDVFQQLLEGQPAPSSPRIIEGSRLCVVTRRGEAARAGSISRITSALFCALVEHCMAIGVREVLTVYDKRIARLLPRIGCRPNWQSREHRIGDTIAMAGRFMTDAAALNELRSAAGITGSVVASAPWLIEDKVA